MIRSSLFMAFGRPGGARVISQELAWKTSEPTCAARDGAEGRCVTVPANRGSERVETCETSGSPLRHGGTYWATDMGLTERLAYSSSRHPWRTFAAWAAALVVALGLSVLFLPGNLTTNGHVTGTPPSLQAERLFYEHFPADRNAVDELIVVNSQAHTVDDLAFKRFVDGLLAQSRATGVIWRASSYYSSHDRSLVSRDRHATLVKIQRRTDVDPLLNVVQRNDGRAGFSAVITGEGTLDHAFNALSQHDLKSGRLPVGLA